MINYAAEKKPDMVLLPECAYPGYIIDDKESLKKALEKGVTHAIFKAKSPSCGVDEIYDGTFTRTLVPGDGVAVRLFKEAGIRVATEDTFKKVFRTS